MELDKDCCDVVDRNINMAVPWYIMAAYAYYVDDEPILSDAGFDRLAKKILSNWEEIDHYHKEYLNEDMLKSGTYLGDYPSRVEGAVQQVKDIYRAKSK
jgi:hypothetical protein